MLLRDGTAIFRRCNAVRLSTKAVVESPSAVRGRPWSSSQSLSDMGKLAALLRPFLIRPKSTRFNGKHARGYKRRWFEQALSKLEGPPAVRTPQP
jgi:hypothetical protein